MKEVTFKEYEEAKKEVLYGKQYKEYSSLEGNVIRKVYCCEDGSEFCEVTEGGVTEFWSTKNSESRKYIERFPQEEAASQDDQETRELRKTVIDRMCRLSYWFANEMLKEEDKDQKFREEAQKMQERKKEHPEEPVTFMVSAAANNARVMKDCMRATVEATNYLRDKKNDIERWQLAGIMGMFDQAKKEQIIPYDLPYAVNGLLLQWDRVTAGAGLMVEVVEK